MFNLKNNIQNNSNRVRNSLQKMQCHQCCILHWILWFFSHAIKDIISCFSPVCLALPHCPQSTAVMSTVVKSCIHTVIISQLVPFHFQLQKWPHELLINGHVNGLCVPGLNVTVWFLCCFIVGSKIELCKRRIGSFMIFIMIYMHLFTSVSNRSDSKAATEIWLNKYL